MNWPLIELFDFGTVFFGNCIAFPDVKDIITEFTLLCT